MKNLIFYVFIAFLFVTGIGDFVFAQNKKPVPVKGFIDVGCLETEEHNTIKLNGEWEFYNGQFLDADDILNGKFSEASFISVPGKWGNLQSLSKGKPGTGFGTYHLVIVAPKIHLGLSFKKIHSASRIYINNDLVSYNGSPSFSREGEIRLSRLQYYYFDNTSDTLHLIIQVSNFHHMHGGIEGSIIIGKTESIRADEYMTVHTTIFGLNLLFVAAILFLLFFAFRRNDLVHLYFALLLLIVILRITAHNDIIMYEWLKATYPLTIRLDFLSENLLAIGMLAYYFTMYPQQQLRRLNLAIIAALSIIALSAFFVPLYTLSNMIFYSRVYGILLLLYATGIIIYRITHSEKTDFLIIFALSLFIIYNFLVVFEEKNSFEIHDLLILLIIVLFVISQIALLAKRHAQLLRNQEVLTDEVQQLNLELEERVKIRTVLLEKKNKSLIESKNKLEHYLKTKDKLFSIIGHDLRSPLATINLYGEKLWDEISDENQRKKLKYIINGSASALHLLSNFLAWGKRELGQIQISPNFVAVDQLIQESVEAFHGIAEAKSLTIWVESDNSVVYADRFSMLIVVNNLLNNAIKFSYADSQIRVSVQRIAAAPDGKVKISVADTGVGMNQNTIDKLLKSTEISSSLGTANEKGSGIGLFIVKDFVKMNHGELIIESEPGKGSIFSVILQTKIWS